VAIASLERVLAQGEPSPAALADLQRLLEEEEAENLPLHGFRGERAGLDQLMANLQNGTVKIADVVGAGGMGLSKGEAFEIMLLSYSSSSRKYQRATLLRIMSEMVETARLPPEQQPQRTGQLFNEVRNQHLLVRLFVPAVTKITETNQRNLALLRCAIAAVAAERYRRAHGNWPASLEALVADGLLQRVPADSNDGAPLRYRVREDRVVLYSIGRDLEDNGGTFDNKSGMTKGTDLGFTLWNVSHRRLLPLPAAESPSGEPDTGPAPPPAAKEGDQ
jgi:hypothetical protein